MASLDQLFLNAATLMLAGMIFVFVFLSLLILFIRYILKPLSLKYPDAQPAVANTLRGAHSQSTQVSPSIVAAISAAVSQYRSKNNIK